jgi:membrane-associated phospholipid phosphatase
MPNSRSLLNQNKLYFIVLTITLLGGFLFLLYNGKTGAFISLNDYHPFLWNVFFINYTFMGDGIFALSLIAFLFFYLKKKQEGIALFYSFLISGIAVQIIKNLVHSTRPTLFFEDGQYLHFIDHVSLAGYESFPSGHTATAFAIATVFALLMKNKKGQLPILMGAVLLGYSRIYLAQHFLLDVLVGALIGTAAGIWAVYLAKNIQRMKGFFKKISFSSVAQNSSPSTIQTA